MAKNRSICSTLVVPAMPEHEEGGAELLRLLLVVQAGVALPEVVVLLELEPTVLRLLPRSARYCRMRRRGGSLRATGAVLPIPFFPFEGDSSAPTRKSWRKSSCEAPELDDSLPRGQH
jgi:hypothetical protein